MLPLEKGYLKNYGERHIPPPHTDPTSYWPTSYWLELIFYYSSSNNSIQKWKYNLGQHRPQVSVLGLKDPIINLFGLLSLEYQSVKLDAPSEGIRLELTESYKRKQLLKNAIRIRRQAVIGGDSLLMQIRTRKANAILFNSTDARGSSILSVRLTLHRRTYVASN